SDYRPKVIIRTGVGSVRPLDPQWQHKGDFTDAMRLMLKTVKVVRVDEPEQVFPAYQQAYTAEGSTIVCEVSDFINEKGGGAATDKEQAKSAAPFTIAAPITALGCNQHGLLRSSTNTCDRAGRHDGPCHRRCARPPRDRRTDSRLGPS